MSQKSKRSYWANQMYVCFLTNLFISLLVLLWMNYCITALWYGDHPPVVLHGWNGSPAQVGLLSSRTQLWVPSPAFHQRTAWSAVELPGSCSEFGLQKTQWADTRRRTSEHQRLDSGSPSFPFIWKKKDFGSSELGWEASDVSGSGGMGHLWPGSGVFPSTVLWVLVVPQFFCGPACLSKTSCGLPSSWRLLVLLQTQRPYDGSRKPLQVFGSDQLSKNCFTIFSFLPWNMFIYTCWFYKNSNLSLFGTIDKNKHIFEMF